MTTRKLSKSKLARSIALGLTLSTSLYWGNVASAAATQYNSAEISNTGVVAYYYDAVTGLKTTVSTGVYASDFNDPTKAIIVAGARYPGHVITTGDGILTITATNMSDLNLANASVSNGIVVSGSGNTITIGANTKTIDFATTPAAVGSNNLKVVGANNSAIMYAKTVAVDNGATDHIAFTNGNVSVTSSTVADTNTNTDMGNGGISYTGYKTITEKAANGGSVTLTDSNVTGVNNGISMTNGDVTIINSTVTGNAGAGITDTAGSVSVTGTTAKAAMITGKTTAGIANTTGNVDLKYTTVAGNTQGITLTGGNIKASNSTITGTNNAGIYGTKGSVELNTTTVSGGNNGINLTGSDVKVLSDSTVQSTKGDGITYTGYVYNAQGNIPSATGGSVTVTDSSVTGFNNGISYTAGDVSTTGTSTKHAIVTGLNFAGISNTTGNVNLSYADITGKTQGINTTTGDVTIAHSKITGTDNAGIYKTTGKIEVSDTTVTGGTNGINMTGGDVKVINGSTVTGNGADGIAYTGYTDINTKSAAGGSVTIADSGSVIGKNNGISNTNGDVTVTGTSTKAATVTGTEGVGILSTTGDINLTYTNVKGKEQGLNGTGGNITVTNSTVTGTEKAGIYNTTGNIEVTNSTVTGGTLGINKTAGSVTLTGTNKTSAKIIGATGGIYGTGKDISLTSGTITATTGDGIQGVNGTIELSNIDIEAGGSGITASATVDGTPYKQTGIVNLINSNITADMNGIDLRNSNNGKVTITNTVVNAKNGFGIDATSHTDVTINGTNVTAGTKGIVATTAGTTLNVYTDNTNKTITAGTVGLEVGGAGSNVHYYGTEPLSIDITNGTDEHINGGIYAHDGATSNNPSMATTITIAGTIAGVKASGLIATSGATINFNNASNFITTDTTEGTIANVDGIYATDNGSTVTMTDGTINITGTNQVNGVHAVAGSKVTLSNLGENFTVAASGSGTVSGVTAVGTDTTVVLNGTNLNKITGVNGKATVLEGSDSAQILTTFDDTNNTSKEIKVEATGTGNATAISATSGANITSKNVKGITVLADATGTATGIISTGTGSTVTVNEATDTNMGTMTVTSTEGAAAGVVATNASKNNIYGYDNITVTGATTTDGVKADGIDSVNTIVMNGTLTATGGSGATTAVSAINEGTDNITGVTSISAKSAGAGAVNGIASDNGTVKVYQADGSSVVPVTAESTGSGDVTAVSASNNGTIENVSNVTATANSGSAYGVTLGAGTNTVKTINNIIATTTSGAYAIGVNATAGTNNLDVAGNVETTNNGTTGKSAGINNADSATLTTTVSGYIKATSNATGNTAAAAVNSSSSGDTTVTVIGTTTAEAPNGDVSVTNNTGTGNVILNAGDAMSAIGDWASGAIDTNGGTTTINGEGNTLTVKGKTFITVAQVANGSTVNLNNVQADAQDPGGLAYSVFDTDKAANVNLIGTTIASSTSINNAADVYYANSISAAGDTLKVTIDNASSLTGAAKAADDDAAKGAINITNAGTWNVTGNSNLNASGVSSLNNTGLVDMTKDGTTAEKQDSSKVAVKYLTHNGNLIIDVSPEKVTAGDQIVTTTTSGNGKIKANILASEQDATYKDFLDTALITATGTADGNYSVTNNGDNNLEVGNWTYSLQPMKQDDGSTIYHLVNNDLLSNKGKTIVSSVVSPDYWYYETNALYSDINNFNGARKDHDVWAHMVHSKNTRTNVWDGTGVGDVDTQYNGVVVGIDKKFSQTAKGSFWGGLMGGYGKVSNDFVGGDADLNSAHVGIYGVYRTNTDWYVGSILKYNRYSSDIKSTTAAGTTGGVRTNDDLSQTGWGLSVIGGKRFTNNKGWFIEPQLELGYHRIGDGEYTLGGSHVKVDAMTSKRVRAGFNVGKTIAYKSGANLDVFAQASLIHEFGDDGKITTYNKYYPNNGSDNLETKFDGTWGLYKLGLNYNTAKGDNGIVALTYNKGSHRSSPLGFELTYNWTF